MRKQIYVINKESVLCSPRGHNFDTQERFDGDELIDLTIRGVTRQFYPHELNGLFIRLEQRVDEKYKRLLAWAKEQECECKWIKRPAPCPNQLWVKCELCEILDDLRGDSETNDEV